MSLRSCLYEGTVRHRRFHPRSHEFRHGLYMLYLDLDELPGVFDGIPFWSARAPAPFWFRREDYLGPPERPLDEAARDAAAEQLGERPSGPVRLLTHLRTMGHVFNPVSFYYLYDGRPARLHSVLAEVTNTPWGERHVYAVRIPEDGERGSWHRLDKRLHVSPFMPMDQSYRWHLKEPDDELFFHMETREGDRRMLDATLELTRRPLSRSSLFRAPLRYPLITLRVIALIHLQALRLWRKRVPFHAHPAAAGRGGTR